MRNIWTAKAGAAALVVMLAGVASAQSNGPTGLSPRVGAFFPTETSKGSVWFGAGLDYKLNSLTSSTPVAGSIGYFGLSADWYSFGNDMDNIPIVLNYNMRVDQLVFGLGAGVEFYDDRSNGGKTGTGFDAQASATYEFGNSATPFFLQAKYFLAQRSDLRGIGVYAGIRF